MRWLNSITNSMDTNLNNLWDTVENTEAWYSASQRGKHNFAPKQQQNMSQILIRRNKATGLNRVT